MVFKIPNDAEAGFGPDSPIASPDSRDFDILVAGIGGTGVVSGCAVTAQGSPNMTVAVAAGVVHFAGTDGGVVVTAGNVTITSNATGNPRFDLIVSDTAGALSAVAGTAAAVPLDPTFTPSTQIVLAQVYVEPSDTTIATNQITDKRCVIGLQPGLGYEMSMGN